MVSYKLRAYLTAEQEQMFRVESGHARFVWNHLLSMKEKAYERRKESVGYAGLSRHITKLKKTINYYFDLILH